MLEALDEQLAFIATSCDAYDAGAEREAKRLATAVRLLVNEPRDATRHSHSLLHRLGVKDQLQLPSTGTVDPAETMPFTALVHLEGTMVVGSPAPPTWRAFAVSRAEILGRASAVSVPTWWSEPVLLDNHMRRWRRMDLILELANKDGGAHYDSLTMHGEALMQGTAMGVGYVPSSSKPYTVELQTLNPVPAAVRTIAEELRIGLADQADLIRGG